jgi:16S rRNA (guanine1207-N2)-methyltransferase
MSHYYKFDEQLQSQQISVSYTFKAIHYTFISDKGVFSKQKVDFGTHLMLNHITQDRVSHILDMGCGYGVVGIVLRKIYPNAQLSMFDINPRAVDLSIKNAQTYEILNAQIKVSDGIPSDIKDVDLAVLNPPIRAGKDIVFKLYKQAHDVLVKNGSLYIVIQKKQGAASSSAYLKTLFDSVTCIAKDKGYFVYKATKY